MKVAVLLSGCGVYDGAEIQESVLTLLHLQEGGAEISIFAPDVNQHHVINHLNGEELKETRNVLQEAARIARGDIKPLPELEISHYEGLVIPGGFGVAKNFTKWAFEGPQGNILPEIQKTIERAHSLGKAILALCMAPTTVAKALPEKQLELTVGTTAEKSPYEIEAIHGGISSTGNSSVNKTHTDYHYDEKNKVICCPCYMMDATLPEINQGIKKSVEQFLKVIG